MNREWLTVEKAAQHLGISATTLRRWCDEERVPHWRIAGQRRFEIKELEDWLRKRRKDVKDDRTNPRRPVPRGF